MVLESLRPGMKNGEKADLGSEPFGIVSHLEKRFSHGTKQNSVDDLRVLKR